MPDNAGRLRDAIRNKDEATWRQILCEMSSREINTGDDEYGSTPLHKACINNNVPAAAALLQTPGVEVNINNRNGDTPIMVAVKCCHKEVLEVMVRDGRVELEEGLEEQDTGGYRSPYSEQQKREIVRLIQEDL